MKIVFEIFQYLFLERELRVFLRLSLIFVITFFSKVFIVLVPLCYGKVIDLLSSQSSGVFEIPIILIIGYGISRFLSTIFNMLREIVLARLTNRIAWNISNEIFKHVHQLSHDFHLMQKPGAISHAIKLGVDGIRIVLSSSITSVIPTLVEVVLIAIVVLKELNINFLLLLMTLIFSYFGIAVYLTGRRLATIQKLNMADMEINSKIIESLSNFEIVKLFNKKEQEAEKLKQACLKQENLAVKSVTELSLLKISEGSISALFFSFLLYYTALEVSSDGVTTGKLVMLMTYLTQLFHPLEILAYEQDNLRKALIDLKNIFEIKNKKPLVVDHPDPLPLLVKDGEIEFEAVSFGYQPDRLIVRNISFTVPSRKTMAIVGKTGSGKTTIFRLLTRLYDVNEGKIFIDGQDICKVSQTTLRGKIGVVSQEINFFNDTLYYNITYPDTTASFTEIKAVCSLAQIDSFIESLSQGYQTVIGEGGLKLSGGEKQRLALARTLLKKPKILILDEATSSLDPLTEKIIQKNLNNLRHQCTIIIIAHRLSTILNADEILVLEAGEIVERGTHNTLLLQGAKNYSLLWKNLAHG